MFASVSKVFTSKAQAAPAPYDYGFPEYGFSVSEMNNSAVKNPYKNADDVVNTILPAHPEYISKVMDCFGVTIDPSSYDITSYGTNPIDPMSPDPSKQNFYSDGDPNNCTDSSEEWTQVRFYIFDTQTMDSIACYLGDDNDSLAQQACSIVANNQSGGSPTSSSSVSQSTGTSGLVNPLSQIQENGALRAERVDQGVDYSGSGPILAIGSGTIMSTTNSGWPGGTFITIKLDDLPGKYVYVAENCKNITVKEGQHVNAGDKLCTLINASPNLEIGWADGQAIGQALAHDVWVGNDDPAYYTAYGKNFSDLLQSLGAPAGTIETGAKELGSLPAGWPAW